MVSMMEIVFWFCVIALGIVLYKSRSPAIRQFIRKYKMPLIVLLLVITAILIIKLAKLLFTVSLIVALVMIAKSKLDRVGIWLVVVAIAIVVVAAPRFFW